MKGDLLIIFVSMMRIELNYIRNAEMTSAILSLCHVDERERMILFLPHYKKI